MRRACALLALAWPAFAGFDAVRPLIIDHTKAGASDSANFTLLVSGTYSYLATVANSGRINNLVTCPVSSISCPADLIYTSDPQCHTVLSWEFESYDPASGLVVAWVKLPALSHTADTVLYECYGNAAITTFQGGSPGSAWDSSTTAVYHFSEVSLGTGDSVHDYGTAARDLMIASSDGSTSGAPVTGKIAGAIRLPNRGDEYAGAYATSSALSGVNPANGWTAALWLKFRSISPFDGTPDTLFGGYRNSYPNNGYGVVTDATGALLGAVTYDGATDTYGVPVLSSAISTGRWYHTVATFDGRALRLYINGAQAAFSTVSYTRSSDVLISLGSGIGGRYANSDYDEARIAATSRSADWILAEYNNQNNPFTFYAVGSEIGSNPAGAPKGGFQPFIE